MATQLQSGITELPQLLCTFSASLCARSRQRHFLFKGEKLKAPRYLIRSSIMFIPLLLLTLPLPAAATTTVTVSSPANGATVSTSITVQASATSTNGVSGWHIYDNSNDVYSAGAVSCISASLTLTVGQHTLVVSAWDNVSGFGDQTVTVSTSGGYQCTLQFCETDDPPHAWMNCGACGNNGGTGTAPVYSFTQGQNLAGRSNVADFSITGPHYTNGYEWHENGALGGVVSNAVYEFDIYVPSAWNPNTNIQAIEFELQQS